MNVYLFKLILLIYKFLITENVILFITFIKICIIENKIRGIIGHATTTYKVLKFSISHCPINNIIVCDISPKSCMFYSKSIYDLPCERNPFSL